MNSCQRVYAMVKGLFCQLVHYLITLNATMAWHPTEADACAFVAQCPEEVHDMTYEGVLHIFALNRLQARHRVRVENHTLLYRIHVPITVQCQGNGCSLSSKDVVRKSFGQLTTGRLTILEMAGDDCCCPHPLVNLRSVSVDFILWSLSIMILSEFGLGLFSSDDKFTPSLNEVVFLWIVLCVLQAENFVFLRGRPILRRSLQRSWLPQA